ncbi:MAG: hypothetical protein HUK13_02385 [Muribaculaceae bacterium]|nr:hypothetical protein [Muribaculaceae bacterium]
MLTKRFKYLCMSLLAMVFSLSLTSCSQDDDEAMTLDGIWQGVIEGDYYHQHYEIDDLWETEIQFAEHGFTSSGRGKEMDYAVNSGRLYLSFFDWEIIGGNIHMFYDDGYRVVITKYYLYWQRDNVLRFRGCFSDYDTGNTVATFDLVKVSDWTRLED